MNVCHLAGVELTTPLDLDALLTERERPLFDQFKERMADVPTLDDITLVRFLRADSCKLDKSEARLRKTLAWRAENSVDDILANPPRRSEQYTRLRVRGWMGEDSQGRPVQFERLGQFFGSGNVNALTTTEWLQVTLWDMERIMNQIRQSSEKSGKACWEYCFIGDVQGYELVNGMKTIPLLQKLTEQIECNYPEIAGCIVLINAPSMLAGLFTKVVKPFMDPITASKVEMHTGVPLERLRELLGGDANIPTCYGGTNTSAFPETEIWQGNLKEAREGEHSVLVAAGQSEEFAQAVPEASTVTWGLRVVEYNIVYTASWEPAEGERRELGRSEEGGKDDHAEGMLAAEGPGRLVFTLSNEHSWMRPKQVYVSVDIVPLPPAEPEPEPEPESEPEPEPEAELGAGAGSGAGGGLDAVAEARAAQQQRLDSMEPQPDPAPS